MIVTIDQRRGAAGGGIAAFNWISDLLRSILSKVSARRDPDLSPLSPERKSDRGDGAGGGGGGGYTISLLRRPINGHRWTGYVYTHALAPHLYPSLIFLYESPSGIRICLGNLPFRTILFFFQLLTVSRM